MPPTTTDALLRHGLGCLISEQVFSLDEVARPAHWARTVVRDSLGGLADGECVQDAMLVTDELVTNAVRHAGGAVSLSLGIFEKGVTVAVADRALPPTSTSVMSAALLTSPDEGPAEPCLEELPEGGRGLLLISELTTAWSVTHTRAAKIVTAAFVAGGEVLART
jgi:anti-sigma regulatory factor (Ser/Thr protein kinase)